MTTMLWNPRLPGFREKDPDYRQKRGAAANGAIRPAPLAAGLAPRDSRAKPGDSRRNGDEIPVPERFGRSASIWPIRRSASVASFSAESLHHLLHPALRH